MSEVAKELQEPMANPDPSQVMFVPGSDENSSSTFTVKKSKEAIPPTEQGAEVNPSSSSSYTLASDQSLYSRQIDRWFQPASLPTEAAVQISRVPVTQRSTLVSSSALDASGLWYMLAMILPLFSVNNSMWWRCTPGTVVNVADLLMNNFRNFCGQARDHVQRLAEDQLARDFFATLMDIVLVIYAIGFLILSLYQASVFG